MLERLHYERNSDYQHKVVITNLLKVYIALLLILSTFYEETYNQEVKIEFRHVLVFKDQNNILQTTIYRRQTDQQNYPIRAPEIAER